MPGKLKSLLNFAVSFTILVGLSCVFTAMGQSGRRSPKSPTVNPPVQEPAPTPSPVSSKPSSQVATKFILSMDEYDHFSTISLNAISGIQRNCAQRMGERTWIKVNTIQRRLVRSEAIKMAKAEKESYVIWLRVREDTMNGRQMGSRNVAFIEFTVYAPESAKIMISGSTYATSQGNVILERRSEIDGDPYLNRAARETADKILSKFIQVAPRPPMAE